MSALQVSCLIFDLNSGDTIDLTNLSKKYKILALKNHPDKNKDNPNATERFKKLKAAYDLLRERSESGRNIVPSFNKDYEYDNSYSDNFDQDFTFHEQYNYQYDQQNIIINELITSIREKYTEYSLTKYTDNDIKQIISYDFTGWLEFMSEYTNTKKQKRFIYENIIKILWKMSI
jgi:DnaJ-class molecular chaperone